MSFSDAIRTCFQKYADFSGRARPSEYWWWALFYFCVIFGLALVTGILSGSDPGSLSFLLVIGWAGLLLPTISVLVRRLHDTGRSGWWWFISLVPIAGGIILFVFLVSAGNPGPNQYGEPVPLNANASRLGPGT